LFLSFFIILFSSVAAGCHRFVDKHRLVAIASSISIGWLPLHHQ